MKTFDITPEMLESLNGEINPLREYYITLGQSISSKGVMFVLYTLNKKCVSVHVNPFNYLGQLSDNLPDAIISARKKVGKFQIILDSEETFRDRKLPDVMGFGKYTGKTIEEIFDIDPKYIFWLGNKANEGQLKVNKRLLNTLNQYYLISKELVIQENKQKSKPSLPIDNQKVERILTCYKIVNNPDYFLQRFKDSDGNIFQYQGRKLVEKEGDVITLKCKVTKSFESLGIIFNKINLR